MIFPEEPSQATVKGMLDPTTLSQSGAAPGALVFPETVRKASGEA